MLKLHKGVYIEDKTIRISADSISRYVPHRILDYLTSFAGYYYCKEEVVMFFCPMLAVKLIDNLYKKDNCTSKSENLHIYLYYVLVSMKQHYPHLMVSDATASFKRFQKMCSESLFSSQTNLDDYFI